MTPDLERIEALAKAATEGNLKLNRYNHGGGRLYADDDLIADFYDESNREFYATCSPQTVLALVAEVKRLRKLDIEHVNDASIEDSDIHRLVARVRELERGLEIIRDFGSHVEFINATLAGAKGGREKNMTMKDYERALALIRGFRIKAVTEQQRIVAQTKLDIAIELIWQAWQAQNVGKSLEQINEDEAKS